MTARPSEMASAVPGSMAQLARHLKGRECAVHFSPLPHRSTVVVSVFPDFQAALESSKDVSRRCEVIRFESVTNISVTTQDTLTMGTLRRIYCNRAGDFCRISLRDTNGTVQEVEFTFASVKVMKAMGSAIRAWIK